MTTSTSSTVTRHSGRSGLIGLVGAAASGALGFLLTVVVTRTFGTDGAGAIFVAIGIVSIAMVACCLGADTALVWALPRQTHKVAVAQLVPIAVLPALCASCLVGVLGFTAAPWLAPIALTDIQPEAVQILRVAFAAVPLATMAVLMLAALRGTRPIGSYVAVNMVAIPAARPILIGVVALLGGGVVAGFAMWVLPFLLAVAVCVAILVSWLGRDASALLTPRAGAWREFWSFAIPRAGSAAIDAGSVWVSVLLVAALAGPDEAGILGGVGRFVMAGLLAMQGLRIAIAPQLSRLLGAQRADDALAVHHQATLWIIVLSWPLYIVMAFFSPGFLQIFGPGFVPGATAFSLLAVAMLVSTGLGNVQSLLLMGGRSRRHLIAAVAGLGTNIVVAVLLIPQHGLVGAAIAWGVGILLENVLAAYFASRMLGRSVVTGTMWKVGVTVAGATTAIAVPIIGLMGRSLPGLAAAVVAVVAAAVTSLGVPRVRAELRQIAGSIRR